MEKTRIGCAKGCVRKAGHQEACVPEFTPEEEAELTTLRREVTTLEGRLGRLQVAAHSLERRRRSAAEWRNR